MRPDLITYADMVVLAAGVFSLAILILGWKRALRMDAKLIIAGVIVLGMMHDLSNTLVFTRVTEVLDRYGDFIMIFIVNLWGFFFYANVQAEANRELGTAKEALERQNVELMKLDRIKDGLVRDVSHELKTPVAKLSMQLELLKASLEKGAGDDVPRILEVMEASLRRQEKVIGNILDLSRLETGGRKYVIQEVPLCELLEEVIEDYRGELESHGFTLNKVLEEVVVKSDRGMLWHVFSNLISNAIKFRTDGGAPLIEVTLERAEGKALVTVRDNGIGMDREDLERVFDRFYKATPSIEGSGVGLNIARIIIKDLGGSIRIESGGKGRGTTVLISI